MRVLILSQSLGVYIGSCMGLGFWSKIENLDMPEAVNFESEKAALEAMHSWDGFMGLPDDITFPHVEDADGDGYSTEEECVNAGDESWTLLNTTT